LKKKILAVTSLDKTIEDLVNETDQKTLAKWACDCVERVLHLYDNHCSDDKRPQEALQACRAWIETGEFSMLKIRKCALASHEAAREIEEFNPARSVARAAGHAVATAHVFTYAKGAALYAATSIRDASKSTDAETRTLKERKCLYCHPLQLRYLS